MKNHNWKLLGIWVSLALLCACLWGGAAMAEDGVSFLEGLNVWVSNRTVEPADDVDIYYDRAYAPDSGETEVSHVLSVRPLDGEAGEKVDTSGVQDRNGCFSLPTTDLDQGRVYRATVKAEAEGFQSVEAYADFMVLAPNDDYDFRLDIHSLDGDRVPVNRWVEFQIYAAGAERVVLHIGEDVREYSADDFDFNDLWDWKRWDDAADELAYIEAFFPQPYGETVRVVSEPQRIVAWIDWDSDPLPAPEFDKLDGVKRGGLLNITINNEIPEDAQTLRAQLFSGEDCVYDEDFAPGNFAVPTVGLPADTYRLEAWYMAEGRASAHNGDVTVEITEDTGDRIFDATAKQVAPWQPYTLYAYAPGAEGVCLFYDWEVWAEYRDTDSFYRTFNHSEEGEHTYYLGVWNAGQEMWERTDLSVNVSVRADEGQLTLPEAGLFLGRPGEDDALEDDVLGEGQSLLIRASALEWPEEAQPVGFNPSDVIYQMSLEDVTEWREVDFREFSFGEDESDLFREWTYEFDGFQTGHEYEVNVYALCAPYVRSSVSRRFIVLPETGGNVSLSLDYEHDGEGRIDVGQDVTIRVEAPDANAVQLFWDKNWQETERDWRGENGVWTWTWSLNNPGPQRIIARVTYDDVDWDNGFDWNELNWSAYSVPVTVSVNDGEAVELPEFTIENNSLDRGELLKIEVGACDENVRAYDIHIKGMDDNGNFWEHMDGLSIHMEGEDVRNAQTFFIPTASLGQGRYRVQVCLCGNQGTRDSESAYENSRYYFTVNDTAESFTYTLTCEGVEVEPDEESEHYRIPTCRDVVISAYVKDARRVCIFEDDDIEEEWDGDSFIWETADDRSSSFTYTLGYWNDAQDDWVRLEDARFVIDFVADEAFIEGQALGLEAPMTATLDAAYNLSFAPVVGAEYYVVEIWVEDGPDIFRLDDPDELSYDGETSRYTVSVDLPRDVEDEGIWPRVDDVCHVNVRACARGHEPLEEELWFLVVPSDEAGLALTLNGSSDEDISLPVNAPVTLQVSEFNGAPDEFQYFWEDNWWRSVDQERLEDFYDAENETLTFTDSCSNPCGQAVLVRARYGEEWVYSNAFNVDFYIPDGHEISLPEIEIKNKGMNRGDALELSIGEWNVDDETKELVDGYSVEIFDAEGDERWECRWREEYEVGTQRAEISTLPLMPGEYRVRFGLMLTDAARAEGWYAPATDDDDESLRFTVKNFEPNAPQFYVTVDGERIEPNESGEYEVGIHTDYRIFAVYPDAENVAIQGDDGDRWENWEYVPNLCQSDNREIEAAGETREYTVEYYDHIEEEWVETALSLTVKAVSYGTLPAPVINAATLFNLEDGADAYSFTVAPAEGEGENPNPTSDIYVQVCPDDDWDNRLIEDNWPERRNAEYDDNTFTLNPGDLEEGRYYAIYADAHAPGYESASTTVRFLVVNGQSDGISLMINNDSDFVSVPVYDETAVKIVIPDADEAQEDYQGPNAVQLFWNGRWEDVNVEDGDYSTVEQDGWRLEQDAFTAIVRASWDGGETWQYGNPVEVTPERYGQVGMPEIELSTNSIPKNGSLTVTLSGLNQLREDNNTAGYNVHICNVCNFSEYWLGVEENGWIPMDEEEGADSATVEIDTSNVRFDDVKTGELAPGLYRVNVHAQGKNGWASDWTDGGDERYMFMVTPEFGLSVSREDEWGELTREASVITHQDVLIHVDQPDGMDYCLYENGEYYREDWDDDGNIGVPKSDAGEYVYELRYRPVGEDEWRPLGQDFTATLTVTSEGEKLDDPVIDVNQNLDITEEYLEFSFRAVEDAGWYNMWVDAYDEEEHFNMLDDGGLCYDPDDVEFWEDGVHNYGDGSSVEYDSGTYTVKVKLQESYVGWDSNDNEKVDCRLKGGMTVAVSVEAYEAGRDAGHARRELMCVEEADQALVLTVNGKNDAVEARAQEALNINISIGLEENRYNPYDVQFFWDNEWRSFGQGEGQYWVDDDFDYHFSELSFEQRRNGGNYTLQFRVRVDGAEAWSYSNAVSLTVTSEGRVGLPDIALEGLDEGAIPRGQRLGLKIENTPEHAEGYHVSIHSLEEWEYWNEYFFEVYDAVDGAIQLPTVDLQKDRRYAVEVYVEPEVGYDDDCTDENDETLRFTVSSGENVFSVEPVDPITEQTISMSAYVKGADRLRVEVTLEGDEGWMDSRESDGNTLRATCGYGHAGTYRFALQQWRDDEWQPVMIGENKAVETVEVANPKGALADPVICLADESATPIPMTLPVNESLAFSVEPDPRIEDNHLNVQVFDESDNEIMAWMDTAERAFTIEANSLEAGREYRIWVYTWQKGYNDAGNEARFTVIPAAEEDMPAIALTVDGSSESVQRVPASKEYVIAYRVDGEEAPAWLDIKWDGEWRNVYDNIGDMRGDNMSASIARSDGEVDRELMIRGWFDSINDYIYSNAIRLEVYAYGFLNMPSAKLANLDENGGIVRGTPLQVTGIALNNNQEVDDREGVACIRLCVYDLDNDWREINNVELDANAVSGNVPTASLEIGRRYALCVRADAIEGWVGNENYGDDAYFFTVTEPEEQAPVLTVSKDNVTTWEDYTLSGYLPGQDRIALFCDGEFEEEWWSDSFTVTRSRWEKGTHTYTLAYWNQNRNDWKQLDEPCCVVVIDTELTLEKATISVAPDLPVNSDLEFSFGRVDNATEYHVNLRDRNNWNDLINYIFMPDDFDDDGKVDVKVPANTFDGYDLGAGFEICVTAAARGYERSESRKNVTLVPEPEAEKTLTLSCAADAFLVRQDIDFTLETNIDGITNVRIVFNNDNNNYIELDEDQLSGKRFSWQAPDGGEWALRARASTDNGETWPYLSNALTIDVETLGAPEFTAALGADKVRKGNSLKLTLSATDEQRATIREFFMDVWKEDDGNAPVLSRSFSASTVNAAIATGELEENRWYRVTVGAIGNEGYSDNWLDDNSLRFKVQPRIQTEATFEATDEVVMPGKAFSFNAYVPGASRLALYEGEAEEPIESVDGDTLNSSEITKDETGDYTFTLKAFESNGEGGDREIEFQEAKIITVHVHDWQYEYTWADDNSTVTASRWCAIEGCEEANHARLTETVTVTAEYTPTPTYNSKGEAILTARFKNNVFAPQTKTGVEVPMLEKDDAVKNVETMIGALREEATLDDKEAVEAARAAYEALTEDQKQQQVSAEALAKLVQAEEKVADAEAAKTAADQDAANDVVSAINALPEEPGLNDKTAVEAARAAYEALTDDQKALVREEDLAKLVQAEKKVADAEAAKAVVDMINGLPENAGVNDKETVEAARAAYESLNQDQKNLIGTDKLNKLIGAEASVTAAEEEKQASDQSAAKAAVDMINALSTSAGVGDKAAVEAARQAYEALTDDQKKLVDASVLKKLTDAEASVAKAEADAQKATEEAEKKAAEDKAAADKVTEAIGTLSTSAGVGDKAAVEAARKAYDSLTEDQKKLVDASVLKKLEDAEASVAKAEADARKAEEEAEKKAAEDKTAADKVTETIKALSTSAGVGDKAAVEAARKAYNSLTEDQKKLVDASVLKKLEDAEASVAKAEADARKAEEEAEKKAAEDKATADKVTEVIKALSESTTLDDKDAVAAARAAYDALTDDQKKLVPEDVVKKLTAAEEQVKAAEEAAKTVDVADCTITVEDQTYTGKALTPAVTVKYGTTTLKKDTDYTLAYGNNKNAGIATVTVTGMGSYNGSKTANFKIAAVKMANLKYTVRDQIYTGKAKKPAVTVKFGATKLKKGTDYTVTYKNNVKVGQATITVKGKGNFTGSKKVTFKINPKGTAFTKLTGGKQKIVLKWKNPKNIKGYEIQYSLKKNFSGAKTVKIKKAKTLTVTIKKLKANKTYYVRIRTYAIVSKKTYYSKWSKTKSVKTKGTSANGEIDEEGTQAVEIDLETDLNDIEQLIDLEMDDILDEDVDLEAAGVLLE